MKYTASHEWVRLEDGGIAAVGITAHARSELGLIVHIELPQMGKAVSSGEEVCVLESTKSAADIYAPVSGRIVAVNEVLAASPERLNADPENGGWLYRIALSRPEEYERLLTQQEYRQLVAAP